MGIPSGVSNATKTGFYLILLVMGLTVMGYTVERCIVVDDDNTALECSKRAHAVLSLGTISAAFCLLLVAIFYSGVGVLLKAELPVALLLVGLWAAAASLVSSPRTRIIKQGGGATSSFESSAAFYCSWIGVVIALLLCYWAASDAGLKVPLPKEKADAAAEADVEKGEATDDDEPVKAADKGADKDAETPKATPVADVEAVSAS
eukprot:TRINITY_DN47_c0_g1_i12.p2 TRINITY_DN47_c0_g1~~TRINITY_DN47_c0_g1_i12.p2  ORF type:complete len:205 (+),score=95.01 TRINITY_DN47_c0_g1_i12:427-1041(+)